MNNCNTKYQRRFFLVSLLVSLLLGLTSGQDCACSPAEYEFTFDFSLVCPPINVTRNGGVDTTFCQIADLGGFDANITDLVPVRFDFRRVYFIFAIKGARLFSLRSPSPRIFLFFRRK